MFGFDEITKVDPEVAAAMTDELNRQNNNLELIASENIVSKAVMAAMGSHLTNKYAEGYPGKILWRMPVCRRSGRSCQRACKRIIWM